MANNETNQAALSIVQQYPPTQYNLLVPMQTVTEIAEIHRPVMNAVSISTNPDDKEIYVQEKARAAWTDRNGNAHPASPAKYAITKKGLTKLMRAAGIKILSSRAVVPSTCQKCAEVNRGIGKPVHCGSCSNKDVKYEVRISVPQLTGENLTIVAHKEIIVEDVVDGMTEKQRGEFMKFRAEMCESKALNRALRTAMQIKGTYLIEEFQKPFVVAYLVPNLDNPDVKAKAVETMFGAAADIYGSRPENSHTIYVSDENEESGGYDAQGGGWDEQPGGYNEDYGIYDEQYSEYEPFEVPPPPPPEPPRQTRQSAARGQKSAQSAAQQTQQGNETYCRDCGEAIGSDVVEYSVKHFGAAYCRSCQKNHQWRK